MRFWWIAILLLSVLVPTKASLTCLSGLVEFNGECVSATNFQVAIDTTQDTSLNCTGEEIVLFYVPPNEFVRSPQVKVSFETGEVIKDTFPSLSGAALASHKVNVSCDSAGITSALQGTLLNFTVELSDDRIFNRRLDVRSQVLQIDFCGNGIVDPGEDCDPAFNSTICTPNCECDASNGWIEFNGRCRPNDQFSVEIETNDDMSFTCEGVENFLIHFPPEESGEYRTTVETSGFEVGSSTDITVSNGSTGFNTLEAFSTNCFGVIDPSDEGAELNFTSKLFNNASELLTTGNQDLVVTFCGDGVVQNFELCDLTVNDTVCTDQCQCDREAGFVEFDGTCIDQDQELVCSFAPNNTGEVLICQPNRLTEQEYHFSFNIPTNSQYNVSYRSEGVSFNQINLSINRTLAPGLYTVNSELLCPPVVETSSMDLYNTFFEVEDLLSPSSCSKVISHSFTYCGNGFGNNGEECDPAGSYPENCTSDCRCQDGFNSTEEVLGFQTTASFCFNTSEFACGMEDYAICDTITNETSVEIALHNPTGQVISDVEVRVLVDGVVTSITVSLDPNTTLFSEMVSVPCDRVDHLNEVVIEVINDTSVDGILCTRDATLFLTTCGNGLTDFALGEPCDYTSDGLEECTRECQCRTSNGFVPYNGKCVDTEEDYGCEIEKEGIPQPLICTSEQKTSADLNFRWSLINNPVTGIYEIGFDNSVIDSFFLISNESVLPGIYSLNNSLQCPPPTADLSVSYDYTFFVREVLNSTLRVDRCTDTESYFFTYCGNGAPDSGEECDPTGDFPENCTSECTCQSGTVSFEGRCVPNDTITCQIDSESPLFCNRTTNTSQVQVQVYLPEGEPFQVIVTENDDLLGLRDITGPGVINTVVEIDCSDPPVEAGVNNLTLAVIDSVGNILPCDHKLLVINSCGDGLFQPESEECESTRENCLSDCLCSAGTDSIIDGSCLDRTVEFDCYPAIEGLTNGSNLLCRDDLIIEVFHNQTLDANLTARLLDDTGALIATYQQFSSLDPFLSPNPIGDSVVCPDNITSYQPPFRLMVEVSVNSTSSEDFCQETISELTIILSTPTESPPCQTDADCDDQIACTTDSCVSGSCVNNPDDSFCSNGIFCDGVERCDPSSGCVPGDSPSCDDGIDCTIDSCDFIADECINIPDDSQCPSGEFCSASSGCIPPPTTFPPTTAPTEVPTEAPTQAPTEVPTEAPTQGPTTAPTAPAKVSTDLKIKVVILVFLIIILILLTLYLLFLLFKSRHRKKSRSQVEMK